TASGVGTARVATARILTKVAAATGIIGVLPFRHRTAPRVAAIRLRAPTAMATPKELVVQETSCGSAEESTHQVAKKAAATPSAVPAAVAGSAPAATRARSVAAGAAPHPTGKHPDQPDDQPDAQENNYANAKDTADAPARLRPAPGIPMRCYWRDITGSVPPI